MFFMLQLYVIFIKIISISFVNNNMLSSIMNVNMYKKIIFIFMHLCIITCIWALSRENLSSEFPAW